MRALALLFTVQNIYKNPVRVLFNTLFLLLFPFLLYFIGGMLLVAVFAMLVITAWIRYRKDPRRTHS